MPLPVLIEEIKNAKRVYNEPVLSRDYPVFPNPEHIWDMVIHWHNNYYPILVDQEFVEWIRDVAPYVKTPFVKQKTWNNFSDITFSVIVYPDGTVNPSRFYIGTIELDDDIREKFYQRLLRFVGQEAYNWAKREEAKGTLRGVGLGVDVVAGEKRVYLMYEKPCPAIRAITTDWYGRVLEDKTYCIDSKGRVHLYGQRGKRLQYNVQKRGEEAKAYIAKLPIPDYAKVYAFEIIDDRYNLDTVSVGRRHGVALYFD